ncbi:MAG: hypothetical protein ACI9XP_000310 [Lentimonas sp.]|jgi:hypothetical protein
MTTKNSLFSLFTIAAIHAIVFIITFNQFTEAPFKIIATPIGYSFFILLVTHCILYIGQKSTNFVNRFLLLTTFQILAVLTFVSAVVYLKLPEMRPLSYTLLSCFIPGMLIQGGFLIALLKKSN